MILSPEEELIRAFVLPERQSRLLALLSDARQRRKLTAGLAQFVALDPRFSQLVSPTQQSAAGVEALLTSRGAPAMCYLLSENAALDGREMPLGDALEAIIGRGMGTFVSCVPGRLAYFESEELGQRYILERPNSTSS